MRNEMPPVGYRRTLRYINPVFVSLLLLLNGCVSYQEKRIHVLEIEESWSSLDAEKASRNVNDTIGQPSSYNLEDGISLQEAEVTALFFNPEIRSARIRSGIPEVQQKYARLWEDPELDIDGEYFSSRSADKLSLVSGLSLTIPLSGRLDVQKQMATETLKANKAALVAEEWALQIQVRENWLRRIFLLDLESILRKRIKELNDIIKVVPRFRAAKVATVVDEQSLQLQLGEVEDELSSLKLEIDNSRLVLLSLMGLHPDGNWKLENNYPGLSYLNQEVFPIDWEGNPSIKKILSYYEVSQLKLKMAVRKQVPDLRVGIGGGRDEGESLMAFGLGLTHLPVLNSNRLEISEAKIEREASQFDVQNRIQSLIGQSASAIRSIKVLQSRLEKMKSQLLPLANRQVDDAMRLARLGELDLFMLVDALEKRGEIELKINLIQADLQQSRLTLLALRGPDFLLNDHLERKQ